MINTTLGLTGEDCCMPVAEHVIRTNAASVVMGRTEYLSRYPMESIHPYKDLTNWIWSP